MSDDKKYGVLSLNSELTLDDDCAVNLFFDGGKELLSQLEDIKSIFSFLKSFSNEDDFREIIEMGLKNHGSLKSYLEFLKKKNCFEVEKLTGSGLYVGRIDDNIMLCSGSDGL